MDELVFAVPAAEIWKLLTYTVQGLISGNSDMLKMIVRKGLFRSRNELEEEPSFKQIIPYAVITCGQSFFLFQRRPGQTEKRLQNLYSLGVGGHMNPGGPTESEEQFIIGELEREINEELIFSNGCIAEDIKFIGFINDDTIPVSRVHMGLLYNIVVSNKDINVSETDKMTALWVGKSDLSKYYEGMETWTRIVADSYIR